MIRSRGSILVGLLWCLALLSVIVIGVLHTASLDLMIVKNHGDLIQAHYLALAGVEKAKALLFQDATTRRRSHLNHSGDLTDSPQQFRDVPLGRGRFRVFRRGSPEEGGKTVFGVTDEESRLNANSASAEELGKLEGMTPDVIAAILDWRDTDNAVSPGGAEAEYYSSLQPPSLPRNGPLQTVRELLMVRGIDPGLLLGPRSNPSEAHDTGSYPDEDPPAEEDQEGGWSRLLTVASTVQNVNAAGEDRIDVKSADETTLTGVKGITPAIAKAIVAARGQNRIEGLADLLDVVPPRPEDATPPPAGPGGPSGSAVRQAVSAQNPPPPNQPGGPPSGERLISENLLMDIADDLTTEAESDLPGLININTASLLVLSCLPGISRELAQAIIAYRQSSGFFPNPAWLLKVPGMNRQIFKQVAARITARSETFRILSEGRVGSSGARKCIEVIVHVGSTHIDTLSYREDL